MRGNSSEIKSHVTVCWTDNMQNFSEMVFNFLSLHFYMNSQLKRFLWKFPLRQALFKWSLFKQNVCILMHSVLGCTLLFLGCLSSWMAATSPAGFLGWSDVPDLFRPLALCCCCRNSSLDLSLLSIPLPFLLLLLPALILNEKWLAVAVTRPAAANPPDWPVLLMGSRKRQHKLVAGSEWSR